MKKKKLTAIQRQTAREMREGAANCKRIERAAKVAELKDKRLAKAAGLSLEDYRHRKFRKWSRKAPAAIQSLETDPYLLLPHQVRRAAAVANALANAHADPNSAVLKLFRASKLIDELKDIVQELF